MMKIFKEVNHTNDSGHLTDQRRDLLIEIKNYGKEQQLFL